LHTKESDAKICVAYYCLMINENSWVELRLQRIARIALALAPRGAVRNDVLVLRDLTMVSGRELRLEWWARRVHPWDCDLPSARQSELFSQQALHDTETALVRLFRRLPEIDQITFRVLDPVASNQVLPAENAARDAALVESKKFDPWVILAGNVKREDVLPVSSSESIKMRLLMMGVRFIMVGDHLEPFASSALWPA
jgi:hypothetical protein